MVRLNPLATAKLKPASKTQAADVFCYLQIEDSAERYPFILNPSSIESKAAANYESLPSAGTNVPRLQYRYGEALTVTLNGLIMLSPQHSASIAPLLDAGKELTRCNPDKNIFNAPICSFVWGGREIKSCVVQSFEFVETLWNPDGQPVHAEGSMSLVEVPPKLKSKPSSGSTQQATPKLTNRELESGSKGAIAWAKANLGSLSVDLQQRVKLRRFKVMTDPTTRAVSITDEKGKVVKQIGTNVRGVFKAK